MCIFLCYSTPGHLGEGKESVSLGRSRVKSQLCHLLSPQRYELESKSIFLDFACVLGTEEGERGRKANS